MSFLNDIGKAIGDIAPTLAAAVGGRFAGEAVREVTKVLGLSDDTSEEDVAKAVQRMTPEQAAALTKADQDFQVRCEELGVQRSAINARDRASARWMQVQIKYAIPGLLAMLIFGGFFGVLTALVFVDVPPENIQALNIALAR